MKTKGEDMDEWECLKEILEYSIKKNGDKPLTTKHLLAMMNMAERKAERDSYLDLVGMGSDD
jgi:hypothetical protein